MLTMSTIENEISKSKMVLAKTSRLGRTREYKSELSINELEKENGYSEIDKLENTAKQYFVYEHVELSNAKLILADCLNQMKMFKYRALYEFASDEEHHALKVEFPDHTNERELLLSKAENLEENLKHNIEKLIKPEDVNNLIKLQIELEEIQSTRELSDELSNYEFDSINQKVEECVDEIAIVESKPYMESDLRDELIICLESQFDAETCKQITDYVESKANDFFSKVEEKSEISYEIAEEEINNIVMELELSREIDSERVMEFKKLAQEDTNNECFFKNVCYELRKPCVKEKNYNFEDRKVEFFAEELLELTIYCRMESKIISDGLSFKRIEIINTEKPSLESEIDINQEVAMQQSLQLLELQRNLKQIEETSESLMQIEDQLAKISVSDECENTASNLSEQKNNENNVLEIKHYAASELQSEMIGFSQFRRSCENEELLLIEEKAQESKKDSEEMLERLYSRSVDDEDLLLLGNIEELLE